jgi:hypothetical protein
MCIYIYEVSVVGVGPLLGMLCGCVVGVRCWGAGACVLSSVFGGEGRLKDHARLSPVFCSALLLGISIAGFYHHPPCPMAPRLVLPTYKGQVSWQQLNPKTIQSATGARYERYKRSTAFAGARAAGMTKRDRYVDVREGYVKKGRQLLDGELGSIVRGASAPVIALWQGEGRGRLGRRRLFHARGNRALRASSLVRRKLLRSPIRCACT